MLLSWLFVNLIIALWGTLLLRLYMPFFPQTWCTWCVPCGSKFVCLVLRRGQVASAVLLDSGTITGNEIHMCAKKYRPVACVHHDVIRVYVYLYIYAFIWFFHISLYMQPESDAHIIIILIIVI